MIINLTYTSDIGTRAEIDLGSYHKEITSLPAVPNSIKVQGKYDFWKVNVPKQLLEQAVLSGADYDPKAMSKQEFLDEAFSSLEPTTLK